MTAIQRIKNSMKNYFTIVVAVLLIVLAGGVLSILGVRAGLAPILFMLGAALIGVPLAVNFFRKMLPSVSDYLGWKPNGSRVIVAAIVCSFPAINITRTLLLGDLNTSNFWVSGVLWRVVGHGIMMPIVEEVVFRLIILLGLMAAGVNAWIALVIQAVLFGLAHQQLGLAGSALAATFAIASGLVLLASRTIVLPILIHIACNVSAVLMTRLHGAEVQPVGVTGPPSADALAYAFVGTLLMLALAIRMYRSMSSTAAFPVQNP